MSEGGRLKSLNIRIMILFLLALSFSSFAFAKKSVRKVQEVNFGEMNLKGTIRNPDGAYLVQKRGVHFMPLVNLQKDFDAKIREASLYAR